MGTITALPSPQLVIGCLLGLTSLNDGAAFRPAAGRQRFRMRGDDTTAHCAATGFGRVATDRILRAASVECSRRSAPRVRATQHSRRARLLAPGGRQGNAVALRQGDHCTTPPGRATSSNDSSSTARTRNLPTDTDASPHRSPRTLPPPSPRGFGASAKPSAAAHGNDDRTPLPSADPRRLRRSRPVLSNNPPQPTHSP